MAASEDNSLDTLNFEMLVDISKKYTNISKQKRVLAPVVTSTISLYVNGLRLNEDEGEVFVVTEFFESLTRQGRIPMYTCSCGIFGCGGFYIDVLYKKETVIWGTEQATFTKYIFSRGNIVRVAEGLINKLVELHQLLQEHGLQTFHDIEATKKRQPRTPCPGLPLFLFTRI
ncbi:hypothetical protein MKZ24_00140 [Paenibacillus sp. FSL R7-0297]|uniref:hypothetical protein n=1 Tax=unclassified Paenibacillus TaxID=185978 RepID=UPI00069496D1|nr:hypothetical protein [Paenibacillus sp. FSL R5-0912]